MSFECITELLSQDWFQATTNLVECFVLGLTLLYIAINTKQAEKVIKLQRDELNLRTKPMISILELAEVTPLSERPRFAFNPCIRNHSDVHALFCAKIEIFIDEEPLLLDENWDYNGKRLWSLQAHAEFTGNPNIQDRISADKIKLHETKVKLLFHSWAINFYFKDRGAILLPENQNPTMEWYWDWNQEKQKGRWMPVPIRPELQIH